MFWADRIPNADFYAVIESLWQAIKDKKNRDGEALELNPQMNCRRGEEETGGVQP